MKIAVIGIGQDMRGDDGAGLEAVRLWQRTHPDEVGSAGIRLRLITVPGLELGDALDGVEAAVVVDATRGIAEPGAVRSCDLSELERSAAGLGSMHGWGLPEELRLGKLLGQFPPDLVVRLIGIEVAQMQLGSPLSPAVCAALPVASDRIQAEIRHIRQR